MEHQNDLLGPVDSAVLQRLGLLTKEVDAWAGWHKILPGMVTCESYNPKGPPYRPHVTSQDTTFPQWNQLPGELKIEVMKHCEPEDFLILYRLSPQLIGLAKPTMDRNTADYLKIPTSIWSVQLFMFLGFEELHARSLLATLPPHAVDSNCERSSNMWKIGHALEWVFRRLSFLYRVLPQAARDDTDDCK
jgi:hypothetical protein